METKLARISQLSKENPDMVFTSIGHLINKDLLKECHVKMDGNKAVGIDGVTKEEYGKNLEENLDNLVEKLKRKSYKPKPARRVERPKDNRKTRPLSIYCYEDKLVQEALRRILEAGFEPQFYDEMMGFRPGRSCHMALRKLNTMIERRPTNYILDADVKGFFDHIDHEWTVRFIESRIKDPNIIRLVRRMLEAGVVEDFWYEETEEGSGQGGGVFPGHSKHLHALCTAVAVPGKDKTILTWVCRNHRICRRLRMLLSIQRGYGSFYLKTETQDETLWFGA